MIEQGKQFALDSRPGELHVRVNELETNSKFSCTIITCTSSASHSNLNSNRHMRSTINLCSPNMLCSESLPNAKFPATSALA